MGIIGEGTGGEWMTRTSRCLLCFRHSLGLTLDLRVRVLLCARKVLLGRCVCARARCEGSDGEYKSEMDCLQRLKVQETLARHVALRKLLDAK